MSKLSWTRLDQCKSSVEIYRLLKSKRIKGWRNDGFMCPLSNATDWIIDYEYRMLCRANNNNFSFIYYNHVPLTKYEKTFVRRFDAGRYPDLIDR